MKVTSKGQVTIPLSIRDEFDLRPGTDIEIIAQAGKVILRPKRKRSNPIEDWLKHATGVAKGRTTTARIMKLTRGED